MGNYFIFFIKLYNYWNFEIVYHYFLHLLDLHPNYHEKLYFIFILVRTIGIKSLLFFYSKQKFLDQYIHIHPLNNHPRTYYSSYFYSYHWHSYHFQTISIIHHFQMDLLHPHNHSNHLLPLCNYFLCFCCFYLHCYADYCLFLYINYLFYRYSLKQDVYFCHLECIYYLNHRSHRTHQILWYRRSSHLGRRRCHLVDYKSLSYHKSHQVLLESI